MKDSFEKCESETLRNSSFEHIIHVKYAKKSLRIASPLFHAKVACFCGAKKSDYGHVFLAYILLSAHKPKYILDLY